MINIGFACKIVDNNNYKIRSCRLSTFTEEKARSITKYNLIILDKIIDYLIEKEIKLFRISSDIIPFASHQINNIKWYEEEKDLLIKIGNKIKKNKIRVSMHPGQYTILNAKDKLILKRAIDDLIYHKKFLDSLGLDNTHKLVLHIGGRYEDKKESMERFIENAKKLPNNILDRLIIENDDKIFNIEDVLYVSEKLNIPVVLDMFHFKLNHNNEINVLEYIDKVKRTWKEKDGRQKVHYSQALFLGKSSHSLTIEPNQFFEEIKGLENIDIMLEVKDKNISVLNIMNIIKKKL